MRVLLITSLLVCACGSSDETGRPIGGERVVKLSFAARAQGKPVACGKILEHLGSDHRTGEIEDFRFYVSDVQLIRADGVAVPVALTGNGQTQSDRVALIDFEDGTGPCSGNTPLVNAEIKGTIAEGDYTGVAFQIGVPSDLNHADPALAKAPLDAAGMSWGWELGYKFLKLELGVKDSTDHFSFHVGSTGCVTPEGASRAETRCERENRASIQLTEFDASAQTIVFDVPALLASTAVGKSSCQSFPESAETCAPLYARLGVDFATGACVKDCAEQQVFRVE